MRFSKKLVASTFALLILFSGVAATAEASRYGPAGLGPNLHRRFVIKQARKSVSQGRSVSGRQIIWFTGPSSRLYRSVPGYRR
ncbi:MAG: hypothetical protein AAGG46_04065 [Planctomycetota bacterium]